MTFKHVKFEDSAVMRSLEKLAKEKGLVSSEPLTKKASAPEVDLAPTANLMENILNLCAGLKQSGLQKQAEEIEEKFFAYKQAQTLYEAFTEKGEDLIDRAHPKGSHKLEDVDADEAVFETILDQHLKSVKMIEKSPTGKLASSKNILGAVKIVLAQESVEEQKLAKLNALMESIRNNLNKIKRISDPELVINMNMDRTIDKTKNPTIDNLEDIKSNVTWYGRKLNPGGFWQYSTTLGMGGLSKDKWSVVQPILEAIGTAVDGAIALRTEINALSSKRILEDKPLSQPTEKKTEVSDPLSSLLGQVSSLKNKLLSWKAFRSISRNAGAAKWIDEEVGNLDDISQRYSAITSDQRQNSVAQLQKEVNEELADINEFEASWIKG